MTPVRMSFSLNDVTELDAFEKLGASSRSRRRTTCAGGDRRGVVREAMDCR